MYCRLVQGFHDNSATLESDSESDDEESHGLPSSEHCVDYDFEAGELGDWNEAEEVRYVPNVQSYTC